MKLLKKAVCIFMASGFTLGVCACEKATKDTFNAKVENTEDGVVWLVNDEMKAFAQNYAKLSDYDNFSGGTLKDYTPERENAYYPVPAVISWEKQNDAEKYVVEISTDKKMKNATVFETTTESLEVADLFMGYGYYYTVTAVNGGNKVKSKTYSFNTAYAPRTINIEGVSNTRDMGGYKTVDGKYRVKQGMVYRTAKLDDITQNGKIQATEIYNVKYDLDVRTPNEGTASDGRGSPLGRNVSYYNFSGIGGVGGPFYIGNDGINSNNTTYINHLKKEIEVFTHEENYPILFHCSIGRDRTGTLAMILDALLGVSEKDICMDYETSFFANLSTDRSTPATMLNLAVKTLRYLDSFGGKDLAESTEFYLMDVVGITSEQIAKIKEIMLEKI